VRYEAINVMLLNEFLKEHQEMEDQTCKLEEQGRKIQEQRATIAQLKQDFQSKLAAHEKQIRALASGLEKVSAQLEMNRPAPRTVVENR
jgi:biopolymer transport protein ExbB/TolQ